MAYTKAVLNRARERLADENRKKHAEYESHLAAAYALRPRLREIDRSLRRISAQAAMACFMTGGESARTIEQLKQESILTATFLLLVSVVLVERF